MLSSPQTTRGLLSSVRNALSILVCNNLMSYLDERLISRKGRVAKATRPLRNFVFEAVYLASVIFLTIKAVGVASSALPSTANLMPFSRLLFSTNALAISLPLASNS
jgi:hypothetical protein